jgi:hypothetical protein
MFMKHSTIARWLIAGAALALSLPAFAEKAAEKPAKAVHGEYIDWPVLGVSHRLDKKTLRAIVGNDVAIKAARSGNTSPWPDGSVIAKLVWKEKTHPNWPQAIVPGEFDGAEAMIKDSKKYAETGGWGFAHWVGKDLVMHEKEKAAACFACHLPMKDADYVYTAPALQ